MNPFASLDRVRVVMSHTTHPGNIGACARAMKVMGLSRLYLVNPKHFPHEDAVAMSSGATDVLDNAVVVDSIEAALAPGPLPPGGAPTLHGEARACELWDVRRPRNKSRFPASFLSKDFEVKSRLPAPFLCVLICFCEMEFIWQASDSTSRVA